MEMQIKHYLAEEGYFLEDDENDDALSFCDLQLNDDEAHNDDVVSRHGLSSPCSDAFEFSIAQSTESSTDQAVLFCGKSIHCKNSTVIETVSYSQWKSESFHYDQLRGTKADEFRVHVTARSNSVRLPETGKRRYPYHSRGNSGGSRRHYKVLIGLAKFPPEMELADMRRRQSRRRAIVVAGGEKLPAVAGGKGGGGSSGKGHWGNFVRALRFRSKFISALARVSLGCVRPV